MLYATQLIGFGAGEGQVGIPPDQIATQTLHFWVRTDAADLTITDTDRVSNWADKSGNGNDLQADTSTARPNLISGALNGRDTVRFNGTDQYLNTTSFTALDTDEIVVYTVFKNISWTANDYLATFHSSSSRALRQIGSSPEIQQSGTAANVNAVSATLGTFFLLESGFKATTSSFQRLDNGAKVTGGDEGDVVDLDQILLGASAAPSLYANVEIAEMAIFSAEITDADEHTGLQDYFNNRYALWS